MEPARNPSFETFLECCGSTSFAAQMASKPPFSSTEQAIEASQNIWWNEVNIPGWLEAFAAHPRIGDIEALERKFSSDKQLPAGEQAAALNTGTKNELQDLAEWNQKYEAKFGYVFLICASGKSSLEVLTALKARFSNQQIEEIRMAAAEQQKITELRLRDLKAWPSKSSTGKCMEELQKGLTGSLISELGGTALSPPITTHVLDVSLGAPGVGIDVTLEFCNPPASVALGLKSFTGDGHWSVIGSSVTNSDGRSGPLMGNSKYVQPGTYRLTFKTGEYFSKSSKAKEGIHSFYPYTSLIFEVKPPQVFEHFHVPLLISPYSYTTYRGS